MTRDMTKENNTIEEILRKFRPLINPKTLHGIDKPICFPEHARMATRIHRDGKKAHTMIDAA